jgi:hypothetical protein
LDIEEIFYYNKSGIIKLKYNFAYIRTTESGIGHVRATTNRN